MMLNFHKTHLYDKGILAETSALISLFTYLENYSLPVKFIHYVKYYNIFTDNSSTYLQKIYTNTTKGTKIFEPRDAWLMLNF